MDEKERKSSLLRQLPGVDHILEIAKNNTYLQDISKPVLVKCVRLVLENLRTDILNKDPAITSSSLTDALILDRLISTAKDLLRPNLLRTINATGVVVHTNLGRSLLCSDAVDQILAIAGRYSNLEFDLKTGKRGSRYSCVEDIICELCGSEAAMVVNNNAGAVLLCLETIARNQKVIISRGELVEIGGSFRIPDVMEKSGAILKEVGTTNRTHLKDYEKAIDDGTALLLKVHRSNYSIEGFTAEVTLKELVELGKKFNLRVMEDLGSGIIIDFSEYGLAKEPTVQESVATGADVIMFSGDKLLGGPQAGIIVGKKETLDAIKQNPITRALRVDKLTLAALEATLALYRDEKKAIDSIPTLRMLLLPLDVIEDRAKQLGKMLEALEEKELSFQYLRLASRAGGGSLPNLELPSVCVGIKIKGMSPNKIEKALRNNTPPIIARLENDFFIIDLRTIQDDELPLINTAFENLLNRN